MSAGSRIGTVVGVIASARLLAAYDEQLRTDAEASGAIALMRRGPLYLIELAGGRGFITYRDLGGASARTVRQLVSEAVAHFVDRAEITRVEWKTRGHDVAPGLHDALLDNGFTPGDQESIMLGETRMLAREVPVPEGIVLRRITDEADVRAMIEMRDAAFGNGVTHETAASLLPRLRGSDGMQLWAAYSGARIVSCGRLEPVAGTQFAGLWGGATTLQWRGRGIYRALTAARARSALGAGKTLMYSESTDYSRPILERAGFVTVSSTTPYWWVRGPG